jgi:Transposase DDE domain group 1
MRIYIIGNDGITLCRKAPATVNDGEIAVASKEELHAARLSGKRLLALWNALPGVEKRKKVGDRDDRRACARIEATKQGLDIRFVVTSLETGSAEHVYQTIYCARGQAENLIKLHKAQLASDRTSCRSPLANQSA